MRHTAVTNLLEVGVDLDRVAHIAGWSPSTTTEMARRYGHLCRASLASAVEKLGGEFDQSAQEALQEGVQKWVQFPKIGTQQFQ
jgi:hypothetical protein